MSHDSTDQTPRGVSISVTIPADNPNLYGNSAIDDLLMFLARRRYQQFTQRELAGHTDVSEATVRRGVDILADNDLVEVEPKGNRTLVSINRDRLSVPDDPFLRIPQEAFRRPAKAAVEILQKELTDVLGIVLYGSVARGEADRRSDVDLWVVVQADRAGNQREANAIAKDLENRPFDGDRYEFHVTVESVDSIPSFTEDVARIVRFGIPVYETESFETLQKLLTGMGDDE
ncbi:MAG: nucleotidyltransferase domain-containing protein [Halanaeroarchaeum sp.]